jgi:4-amino-4-deoxy-L-arabinose transferase-like glycosyltransferase
LSENETVINVTDSFCLRNRKWILLLLLLISYPLLFHKLGDRDIWSPDEDEYVQVNREMVLDGHWMYPTVNGQPYSIKPPLFNWLGSCFFRSFGWLDCSFSFPSQKRSAANTSCRYIPQWRCWWGT